MESVPPYVSITALLTTFTAVGIFLYAVRDAGRTIAAANRTVFLLALWIVFQSAVAYSGFYTVSPAGIFIFAVLPALLGVLIFLTLWARSERSLSLRILTAIHIVRIPVAFVQYALSQNRLIPKMLTFEGVNFDFVFGIAALFLVFIGFDNKDPKRTVLFVFNIIGLLSLLSIAAAAAMSIPGTFHILNMETPNLAVLYFPYTFLPAITVPLVLFAHIESLRQLAGKASATKPIIRP